MRIFLDSIGCRLNTSEIESMARRLMAAGHEVLPEPDAAEHVVINTCAVTAEAARDARKLTRRIHRDNPGARIHLTGCYATISPDELERFDGVADVIPNAEKGALVGLLDPSLQASDSDEALHDREPMLREFLASHAGNTRAFVKVQDGCDNRCTFCVTTVARGAGASRSLGDVVAEIAALSRAGYREAVLTGVHLGSWGKDFDLGPSSPSHPGSSRLAALVQAILERTGIERLRLSSLEPWDLEPEFFDLWRDARVLPHLHLPLQAGCDRTLRRMARNTTREDFRALCDAARERIPDLHVSTDVIVGFPGETDADFEESLAYVREIEFGRLHVFSYSSRPETAAANMPDHVDGSVKKARARRMIDLGRELSLRFHARHVERELPVLWESSMEVGDDMKIWGGYTDNYVRVTTRSNENLFNEIRAARLSEAGPDGCAGELQ